MEMADIRTKGQDRLADKNKRSENGIYMKIKDVEKLTGLTAKSIRYYESKGLLQVKREEENLYRSYTQENVQQLKRIHLLRFLDFSIDQIRDIQQMDAQQVKKVLLDKAEALENQRQDIKLKRDLCHTLSKDGIFHDAVVDEYNEMFVASDEKGQDDLEELLKDLRCPSLAEVIGETAVCSGPILWLFVNIYEQKWKVLLLNAVLAVLFTTFVTGIWINYLQKRKYQPQRMQKNNKATWYIIPSVLIGCILGIVVVAFISAKVETLLAPQGWLFYQLEPWAEKLLIYLIMIPLMFFVAIFGKIDREKKTSEKIQVLGWETFRKYWYIFILVWLLIMYFTLTRVTFFTKDKIIIYTPLCPKGESYDYEDVAKVNTGFGQKTFSFLDYNRRGTFYYTILVDGRQIVLCQPSVNGQITRYEEDTYLELEEFDQRLMELGVPKESDEMGYEDCDFDLQYVERFRRIIANH